MADRIRRSVASRTEMLAGISHDLRTPLTRMKLEIEMAKMDTASRDAIATDIDEMRRMVDEYLDFARGDAGEPMTPLDIAALLRDMARAYRKQGQKVHLGECSEAVLMVRPHALRRALQNLIENAVRYGQVAFVSLEQSVAFVRIKVADHGPGIPEAEQENVFKPFTPPRTVAQRGDRRGGPRPFHRPRHRAEPWRRYRAREPARRAGPHHRPRSDPAPAARDHAGIRHAGIRKGRRFPGALFHPQNDPSLTRLFWSPWRLPACRSWSVLPGFRWRGG